MSSRRERARDSGENKECGSAQEDLLWLEADERVGGAETIEEGLRQGVGEAADGSKRLGASDRGGTKMFYTTLSLFDPPQLFPHKTLHSHHSFSSIPMHHHCHH